MQFVALFDLVETDGQGAVAKLDQEFGKGRAGFYPGDIVIANEFEGKINSDIINYFSIEFHNAALLILKPLFLT